MLKCKNHIQLALICPGIAFRILHACTGTLAGYQDGAITLDLGGETATFSKEEVASVRLHLGF